MLELLRFIFVLIAITFLIFLFGTRFLSIGGINPNLVLILFIGLIFIPLFKKIIKPSYFFVLLIFSSLFGFFLFDFWFIPWIVLLLLIVAIYFSKNLFTGRPLPDFLIALIIGTMLFYAVLILFMGGAFEFHFIFWEVVYNLILGSIFWHLIRLIQKYARL